MAARQLSILMVCAFAAGCSGSSSADAGASIAEPDSSVSENLYGVWLTPDNSNHLSFNEDDT